MSTPFLRDRRLNFARVFNVPLLSVLRMRFFLLFFPNIRVFVFLGCLGLKGSQISSKKKNKKPEKPIRKKLGRDTLNTCAKFQGLSLKNGVDTLTFVLYSAKITAWRRNFYLVLVYIRFRALNLTWYWSYAVSSSTMCAKVCANMPWSTWKRLVQKKRALFFSCYRQCLSLLLTSLKVCDWPGHIFGASASSRPLTKKLAMSPSTTVEEFMPVSMMPNIMWHAASCYVLLHPSFGADEIWSFMLKPAREWNPCCFPAIITNAQEVPRMPLNCCAAYNTVC